MSAKRRTSLYTPARASGSDQLAKWRAELAKQAKASRQRRGRRVREQLVTYRPGMGRVGTAGDGDGDHPDHPPTARDHPWTVNRKTAGQTTAWIATERYDGPDDPARFTYTHTALGR